MEKQKKVVIVGWSYCGKKTLANVLELVDDHNVTYTRPHDDKKDMETFLDNCLKHDMIILMYTRGDDFEFIQDAVPVLLQRKDSRQLVAVVRSKADHDIKSKVRRGIPEDDAVKQLKVEAEKELQYLLGREIFLQVPNFLVSLKDGFFDGENGKGKRFDEQELVKFVLL
jgi:hypothetical protein